MNGDEHIGVLLPDRRIPVGVADPFVARAGHNDLCALRFKQSLDLGGDGEIDILLLAEIG